MDTETNLNKFHDNNKSDNKIANGNNNNLEENIKLKILKNGELLNEKNQQDNL